MKGPEKQTKRPMDAGVLMPVPCMPLSCLSEPMGGEKAPRSLQNLWRLHQFGKPRTLDLSASQAGKNGERQGNHDPGKTMPPNAIWKLKLLMPYIRISTATIGSVPTALKAVRAHKRNQQKPQGKAAPQGGARQTHGAIDAQVLPFALHKISAGEQGNHQHDIRQQGPSSRGRSRRQVPPAAPQVSGRSAFSSCPLSLNNLPHCCECSISSISNDKMHIKYLLIMFFHS